MFRVGCFEHPISGSRVFVPAAERFQVHWAEFPLAKRIFDAGIETLLLLFLSNFEPIFDEDNAGIYHVLFHRGAKFEKLPVLLVTAKSHDMFDAGPVVPTAVEDHYLSCSGKMCNITLHVHLRFLATRRGR